MRRDHARSLLACSGILALVKLGRRCNREGLGLNRNGLLSGTVQCPGQSKAILFMDKG